MWDYHTAARKRATTYAVRRKCILRRELGGGQDGVVYEVDREEDHSRPLDSNASTVIKCFVHAQQYKQELDVYRYLTDHGIDKVLEFSLPKLLDFHDELLVVEMTLVSRPCILDFAGAGICRPLIEYDQQTLMETRETQREKFGENWPKVQEVLAELRGLDIYLADINPGNIMFPDADED